MKKKMISMAVAAALTGGAGLAQAVNISETGLGQVLLFPYYTVNSDFDTYINVTNTSPYTAMFKIRFREAHNSRDARDFNVIMSPYDVWNATVTRPAGSSTPRLTTRDTTCTAPRLPLDLGNGVLGVDFTNLDYITPGTNNEARADWTGAAGTSIARTQQGHFEVLLMGLSSADPESETTPPTAAYMAKHAGNPWQPRDCAGIVTRFQTNIGSLINEFDSMGNVLKGASTLLKAGEGKAVGVDPTVLANWRSAAIVQTPASVQPHLGNADPFADTLGSVLGGYGGFDDGQDAVSAVLMADSVINQFTVNPNNNSATDWVVTFPTKNFYVDSGTIGTANPEALPPFVERFQATDTTGSYGGAGKSCVQVSFGYYDREERGPGDDSTLNFSPAPPGQPDAAICKETNVITFNNSNVLGAPDAVTDDGIRYNVALENNIVNGWMQLNFTNSNDLVDNQDVTWGGLPVIGFAITTREDGVSASERLSYGSAWTHSYKRSTSSTNFYENAPVF